MSSRLTSSGDRIEYEVARIAVGIGFAADALVVCGLIGFLTGLREYPRPLFGFAAWALLIATIVIQQVRIRRQAEPRRSYLPALFALLTIVTLLDIVGVWGAPGVFPLAAWAASAGILLAAVVWGPWPIVAATGVLTAALAATTLYSTPLTGSTRPADGIVLMAGAVAVSLTGLVLVRAFRKVVRVEVEKSQASATVTAPRFSVGMLASEELVRLDLDAERLLESVAKGQTRLPLERRTAAAAGSLATRLRAHLLEGRRATWLFHAITESPLLSAVVTLEDRLGLAGLFSRQQRNALLTAVWQLAGDVGRREQRMNIRVDPEGYHSAGSLIVPITFTVYGSRTARLDPVVRTAFEKLGPYVEDARSTFLRVEIDCVVESSVDHQTPGL